MTTSLRALIDADVLVYSSAFGAQKTRYDVTIDGEKRTFENAKERDEFLESLNLTKDDVHIESWIDILEESAAISIAKRNLEFILDSLSTNHYTLFLTGEKNYRDEVAVTKPYKGNRQQAKPVHYNVVKQFFKTRGARQVEGLEADDLLGIYATKQPKRNVICTIDKDLNMVPGLHFNWNEETKYTVTKEKGDKFFLKQLLTGDSTDNITGVPKFGKVKADNLLDPIDCNVEAYNTVIQTYKDANKDMDYLTEQARLLWIKRKIDEPLWSHDWFLDYLGEAK